MPTVVQDLPQDVLLSKILPLGELFVCDKPYIVRADGSKTQLSLDLRFWYDRKSKEGFSKRVFRSDADVIKLALAWAESRRMICQP